MISLKTNSGKYKMKKPKSFEECYFSTLRSYISVGQIERDVEECRENIAKYKQTIFCPECRQARLSFVSKTSKRKSHLKAIDINEHKNCSYIYEYAEKNQVVEYFDKFSDEQIEDKLNAILNMLCKKDGITSSHHNQEIASDDNPMLITVTDDKNTHSYRAIRRKSLQGWLEVDDKEQWYVFYGQVKLSTKRAKGKYGEFYIMNISVKNRENQWKKKVSTTRKTEFSNIDESQVYRIAIIGKLDIQYMRINLYNSNSFKYEVI